MYFFRQNNYLLFTIILSLSNVFGKDFSTEKSTSYSNETLYENYNVGVRMGIVDPAKYSFNSFLKDDENIFRDTFQEFLSLNYTGPIDYQEWLIMNNFGILSDTQESLYEKKIIKRSTADNKRRFVNTVKKGDILITGRGMGGLIGHAAIMSTDYWVLEMPGGRGWQNGIRNNNRQISKAKWFDEHSSDWTSVYRCPDGAAARAAAAWADHHYYNPNGGAKKTIHITYSLTPRITVVNPSYCSKLVIQAYYFGTGKKKVIKNLSVIGRLIVPSTIPAYFLKPYQLQHKGKF